MIQHRLLKRQLTKWNLSKDSLPTEMSEWQEFLMVIERTYSELDTQRVFNENLIDVSTKEMERLYRALEKKSKLEIEMQEEKLSLVIEAVPSLVGWVDQKGLILGLNSQLAELLGVTKIEAIGHSFGKFGLSKIESFVDRFFDAKSSEISMHLQHFHEGEERFYKFVFKRFYNDQMVALVGVDLTEEKKHQTELELARTKSMTSSRMAVLGEMAAGIAHEINNPLSIIRSMSSLIGRNLKSQAYDEIPEKLEKIQKTVIRITKIISGLRTFARDGENDPFIDTSVASIIEDTLELAKQRLESMNIELKTTNIDRSLSVESRATQISQVILNILNNSRDAVQNLESKWISIEAVDSGENVKVIITDSGHGIPQHIQDKIFQPFFTTKEVGVGTGLGLSISVGIIQAHNGKFYIDSKCANTRFVIELPKLQKKSKAA